VRTQHAEAASDVANPGRKLIHRPTIARAGASIDSTWRT
jgi:hypothetical protein